MRRFDARAVPAPRDGTYFPETRGPIDLEIGCGVGLHPIQYAHAEPHRTLIAIERTKERFSRFARRLENHPQITNVVAICDDAISWIVHRVPEGVISRLFLLYPNPYPKAKQANKRFHHMPFMAHLLRCLVPGGTVHLATNEAFYAEEAKDAFTTTWGCVLKSDRELTAASFADCPTRTHFEAKYLARGHVCYDLVFQKGRVAT